MKRSYEPRNYPLIVIAILSFYVSTYAQVGIGNTSPNTNAILEIGDGTDTEGLLLPRVALTNTTSPSPMGSDVAGMIVYNTATAGDVTPGFYYNNGATWIRLGAGTPSDDWTTTGNSGTNTTSNFLGTTDNVALRLRTRDFNRFEVTSGTTQANGGRLRAFTNGSAGTPIYSWNSDADIGMYRIGANTLGLSTNGTERMRLLSDGRVSVNDNSPYAGDTFTSVANSSGDYAVNGYSSGSGTGVYGSNTGSGDGVFGANSSNGTGVYGQNTSSGAGLIGFNNSTGVGIYAVNQSTGIAGYFDSYSGNYSLYGLDGPIRAQNVTYGGEGIMGFTDSSTIWSGGLENGVWGSNDDAGGTAVLGGTANTWVLPTNGSGVSGSSPVLGIFGYAANGTVLATNYGNAGGNFNLDSDANPNTLNDRASAVIAGFDNVAANGFGGTVLAAQDSYFGGYFSGGSESSGTPSYAYVGLRHNTAADGSSGTDYKIIGPGNVSTLIDDSEGKPRIMFAPEAPEIVFHDYGVGQLINGTVRINLDPVLKNSLHIDNEHPLKVYVTLEGECNGIYVTNKSADGFTVIELQGGRSNAPFSWQIVANRADNRDSSGRVVSKHVGLRLPIGPTQLKPIEKQSKVPRNPTTKPQKSEGRYKVQVKEKTKKEPSNK